MRLEPPRLVVEPLSAPSSSVAPELGLAARRISAPGSSRRRPEAAPGTDGGPCRHGRTRTAPDRRSGRARRARPRRPWPARARCARRRPGRAAARRNPPDRDRPRPRECRAGAARSTSLGADIVMRRHDQMRQHELAAAAGGWRLLARARARDSSRAMPSGPSERGDRAGRGASLRPAVGEVDDLALPRPFDRGMRLVDEARQPFRQPVIAARLPALAVHALLDDDPAAVVGDDEAVQIELEAVLHRGAVDLGDQPARSRQRVRRRSRRGRRWRRAPAASAANACRARRRHGCRARPPAAPARASARRSRWW